jgi:hypothetical protein
MDRAFGAVDGEIGGGIANQNCHCLVLAGHAPDVRIS